MRHKYVPLYQNLAKTVEMLASRFGCAEWGQLAMTVRRGEDIGDMFNRLYETGDREQKSPLGQIARAHIRALDLILHVAQAARLGERSPELARVLWYSERYPCKVRGAFTEAFDGPYYGDSWYHMNPMAYDYAEGIETLAAEIRRDLSKELRSLRAKQKRAARQEAS